jgi:hypothetical protein
MTVTNPADGKEKKVEIYFAEFKEFDGIKLATRTKTYHDGKLFIDTEITEFKIAKAFPSDVFEKPKK